MAADVVLERRSLLDALAGDLATARHGTVRIEPVPLGSVLNLRGQATDEFASVVEAIMGVALPLEPNRWNGHGGRSAIWLGPDEWLLAAQDGDSKRLEKALRAALPEATGLSVVDVSHNCTGLLLSGSAVRDLLDRGCTLDLHPEAAGPGDCFQTLLAGVQVMLRILDGTTATVEIRMRNSYASHVARWLLDARDRASPS